MNIISILIILFFSGVLIKAADLVIISLKKISSRTKTGVFALSAIILALGTSLPELFVSFTSALEGVSNLTLGVVIGSNIANISLVVGIAALIGGKARVKDEFLHRDVIIALIAGVAPILLIVDRNLSRVDGLVLLAVYATYATSIFKKRFKQISKEEGPKEDVFNRFIRKVAHFDGKESRDYGRLFIGITLLLLSSDMIVKTSKSLAISMDVPVFVIGLLILAVGTSLPELAFSFRSLEDHEPGMFFGNILGSTIINSTLIIGLAAVISPIKIQALEEYAVAIMAFVVIFITFWQFIKTKHRLDRWEAAILVALYAAFAIIEFV